MLEVIRSVVIELARRQGQDLAIRLGRNDLEAYAKSVEPWTRNDALQLRILDSLS